MAPGATGLEAGAFRGRARRRAGVVVHAEAGDEIAVRTQRERVVRVGDEPGVDIAFGARVDLHRALSSEDRKLVDRIAIEPRHDAVAERRRRQ